MAPKKPLTEYDAFFDDEELMEGGDSYEDDIVAGMMGGMLEASNNHMLIALELTKLIVGKHPDSNDKNREKHVFSVFNKANQIVNDNFVLKNAFDTIEQ